MKLIAFTFFFFLATSGCKKEHNIPQCISEKITSFSSSLVCQNGASVKEYSFQGGLVYVFSMGNCGADLSAGVYDSNCNYLGFLGGFTGNTKINGVEFSTAAVYKRTVWSN